MSEKLVLATASPYSIAVFKTLGIDFESESSDVDERFATRSTDPKEIVLLLARLKAECVAKKRSLDLVVGFDSVGCFEGRILEKPPSSQEAFERLKALSGKSFDFYTGVHLIDSGAGNAVSKLAQTRIQMRVLQDEEINNVRNARGVSTHSCCLWQNE
ncbi:TPA: hypothetical protein HA318_02670 [Candidatus Micrarchaeota archaeon]|nr:hypothetical protein [Candidatus Micrarchaeota archaeon]